MRGAHNFDIEGQVSALSNQQQPLRQGQDDIYIAPGTGQTLKNEAGSEQCTEQVAPQNGHYIFNRKEAVCARTTG